jgi:hypothetical protein
MFRIFKNGEMDTINRTLAEVRELRSEISGLREHLGKIIPPVADMPPEDNGEGLVYDAKVDSDCETAAEIAFADMVTDDKREEALDAAPGEAGVEQVICRNKSGKEEPDDIGAADVYCAAEGPETVEICAGTAVMAAVEEELPSQKEILAEQVKKEWAVVRYSSGNKFWWRFWNKKTSLY